MHNYPLLDPEGKILGVVSLETPDLANSMARGTRVTLDPIFEVGSRRVQSMTAMEIPTYGDEEDER